MATTDTESNPAATRAAERAKMIAKHAETLAEFDRETAIYERLPALPIAPRVHVFGKKQPQPWIIYKCASLAQALEILAAFKPEPFLFLRGTFLHIEPREWIKPDEIERAKEEISCEGGPNTAPGAVLDISGGRGFGPDARLTQWARVGDVLAKISCELGVHPSGQGFPPKWHVRSSVNYNSHGEVTSAEHLPPAIVSDIPRVKWASGSRDAYHFSWVWQERPQFLNEMESFLPGAAGLNAAE